MIEDDYKRPQLHIVHNLQVIVVNHANNNMKNKGIVTCWNEHAKLEMESHDDTKIR
jgi:hypothetical protein